MIFLGFVSNFLANRIKKETREYYENKLKNIKSDFEHKNQVEYYNKLSNNYLDFVLKNKYLLLKSRFYRFLGYFFLFLFFITFFVIVRNIFNRFVLKRGNPSSL